MSDRRMDELKQLSDDELGELLAQAASTAFPPTPNVAPQVQARLEREGIAYPQLRPRAVGSSLPTALRGWRWPRLRRSVVLALIALLIVAAVAAAVIFGVPGIRLSFVETLPTVPPTPTAAPPTAAPATQVPATDQPSPSTAPVGVALGLGRPSTLEEARAAVGFSVMVPSDPALGAPDAIYLDTTPIGGALSFVYGPRTGIPVSGNTGVAVLLTEFDGVMNPEQFQKLIASGAEVANVPVRDSNGVWIGGGGHFFISRDFTTGNWNEQRMRLAGHTLLWTKDRVTYRLEAEVDRDTAVRIAETLTP